MFRSRSFSTAKSGGTTTSVDLSKPAQLSINGTLKNGSLLSGKLSVSAESENSIVLLGLAQEFLSAIDDSNLFYFVSDRLDNRLTAAAIDVSHGQIETTFNINLKADNATSARMMANGFKNLFSAAKVIRRGTPEVKFYENAAINTGNDQVTIVTHMPRELLKSSLTCTHFKGRNEAIFQFFLLPIAIVNRYLPFRLARVLPIRQSI